MDAVEFLKEKDRMCKSFDQTVCRDRDDVTCELRHKCTEEISCYEYIKKHPEEAVAIVERWVKEHPRKTRQSEFLKMFPKVSMTADGIIAFCPLSMDKEFACPEKAKLYSGECACPDCRKKYWLEEVEEDGD